MRLGGKESGVSLVGVMVSIGIIGLLALISAQTMTNASNHQKSIELRGDLASTKRSIVENIDCKLSMPTGDCTEGTFVPIYFTGNRPFLGKHKEDGQSVGKWSFRAACRKAGIFIQNGRPRDPKDLGNGNGKFKKDLHTGRALNWEDLDSSGLPTCARATADKDKDKEPPGTFLGGQCQITQNVFKRGQKLESWGDRSAKSYKCPKEYPVALSIDEGGACGSSNAQGTVTDWVNGVPTGGRCSLKFFADRTDLSSDERLKVHSDCDKKKASITEASCNVTCCKK